MPDDVMVKLVYKSKAGAIRHTRDFAIGADIDAVFDRPFPMVIGSSGTGQVPKSLRHRFKHFANAREDFNVELFEPDGVTVRDNTADLQDAIDKLQAYEGCLFIPPQDGANGDGMATFYVTDGLTMRDTGGRAGLSVAIEGLGSNERTVGLNVDVRTADGVALFDRGVGLKLKDGANKPLLTMPADCGHLVMPPDDLILAADRALYCAKTEGRDRLCRADAFPSH